jgi:hypothetical protein
MNGRFTLTTALVAAALLVPTQAWAAPGASSTADGYSTVEAGEMAIDPDDAAGLGLSDVEALGWECKRVWAGRVYRNFVGMVLWRYRQQQGFCYNGSRITSLYDWRRWAEVYAAGWDFKGHIGRATTGGAGTWHYGTWTQGKFSLCWQWCVDTKLPWVDIDVYGNGGWSHKTGGT